MVKFLKITVTSILFLCSISCALDIDAKEGIKGNGTIEKENRQLAYNFNSIVSSENLNVFVAQKQEFSVLVEGDENIIDFIKTDIQDKKLIIHTSKNIGRATKNVFVTLPRVSSLASNTGSILQTQGVIKAENIGIAAGTGSFLNAEVYGDEIHISGKEGARLRISGKTENITVEISSGSVINAEKLESITCSAIASYGGSLVVQVSQSLIANANTGGSVSYIGSPKVDKTKSLTGDVQKY